MAPSSRTPTQEGVVRQGAVRVSGDVDGLDREGVEYVEKAADVVCVRVANRVSSKTPSPQGSASELGLQKGVARQCNFMEAEVRPSPALELRPHGVLNSKKFAKPRSYETGE